MRSFAVATLLLLALAACSSSSSPDTPVDDDHSPPSAAGAPPAVLVISNDNGGVGDPGLSVSQALGHRATDDLVFVSGALFVNADGTMLLCEAIAESFPPQCGGARLEVRGLDLRTVENLQAADAVRWAEQVVLFGSVE
jgi:hypothetical protein